MEVAKGTFYFIYAIPFTCSLHFNSFLLYFDPCVRFAGKFSNLTLKMKYIDIAIGIRVFDGALEQFVSYCFVLNSRYVM